MPLGRRDLESAARAHGVHDPDVLEALRSTPRERFVPPDLRHLADRDQPVPLPGGQTTSQPSLVCQMVAALALGPDDAVLEIGTGYGFQTALLAGLAGRVVSVERDAELAAAARANLDAHGVRDVEVIVGDGTLGWPHGAPYDAVVVSAAFPDVPAPLAEQLRDGGRLVMPLRAGEHDEVVLFGRRDGRLRRRRLLTGARFVPLTGRFGYPR